VPDDLDARHAATGLASGRFLTIAFRTAEHLVLLHPVRQLALFAAVVGYRAATADPVALPCRVERTGLACSAVLPEIGAVDCGRPQFGADSERWHETIMHIGGIVDGIAATVSLRLLGFLALWDHRRLGEMVVMMGEVCSSCRRLMMAEMENLRTCVCVQRGSRERFLVLWVRCRWGEMVVMTVEGWVGCRSSMVVLVV
jgi:hypothetical protein